MISSSESELLLPDPDQKEILLKVRGEGDLSDAKDLVLLGRPFDQEQEAIEAGRGWVGVLQKAFAHLNVGADFGERAARGRITPYGLKMLAEAGSQPVLNDVHGVSVFEYPPEPRFASIGPVQPVTGPPSDRVTAAVARALEVGALMSGSEQLAYDLYAGSFSEGSPDARFLMLMMAVETLIRPAPRDSAVRAHIDTVIKLTREAELPGAEIDSIVGSLRWLQDESINQAGRKLVAKLGDRTYMNESESAKKFFTKCYSLRSALVHGHNPRPSREEIGSRAASMERFVADLLSLELYDEQ